MVNWDLKWRRESMRQRATVKLFQMVEAAEKAALKTLEKFRPRERPSGKEGMETQKPPKPAMMFGPEKRSQPKRKISATQQRPSYFSQIKISACTLHWSLPAYCWAACYSTFSSWINGQYVPMWENQKRSESAVQIKTTLKSGNVWNPDSHPDPGVQAFLLGSEFLFFRVAFASSQTAKICWTCCFLCPVCYLDCYKEKTIPRDNNC